MCHRRTTVVRPHHDAAGAEQLASGCGALGRGFRRRCDRRLRGTPHRWRRGGRAASRRGTDPCRAQPRWQGWSTRWMRPWRVRRSSPPSICARWRCASRRRSPTPWSMWCRESADELDVNAVVSARAQLLVDHLSALRSGDAPMLETVAAEHERQGRALAAADVLAHAAAAHRRGDTPFRAMMCVARARRSVRRRELGASVDPARSSVRR